MSVTRRKLICSSALSLWSNISTWHYSAAIPVLGQDSIFKLFNTIDPLGIRFSRHVFVCVSSSALWISALFRRMTIIWLLKPNFTLKTLKSNKTNLAAKITASTLPRHIFYRKAILLFCFWVHCFGGHAAYDEYHEQCLINCKWNGQLPPNELGGIQWEVRWPHASIHQIDTVNAKTSTITHIPHWKNNEKRKHFGGADLMPPFHDSTVHFTLLAWKINCLGCLCQQIRSLPFWACSTPILHGEKYYLLQISNYYLVK